MNVKGCGLGLRSEFLLELDEHTFRPDWWEVTPENWLSMPTIFKEAFEKEVFSRPTVAHGLALSIGSAEPLNKKFVRQIKRFLDYYHIADYSEHLSFTSLGGKHTYELLPLPMTANMVSIVGDKIEQVQEILKREIILENATYYFVPKSTMSEVDFINEIMKQRGAKLLLDINNIFVNASNHGFCAKDFIDKIDKDNVAYIHIAGHYDDKELGAKIDSHGMPVCAGVWELLEYACRQMEVPVLLERDNNIPPYEVLQKEYLAMQKIVGNR